MDRKKISDRLRALAAGEQHRSKAARLRDILEDVEAALAAGVSRAAVIEELGKHGLEMSLRTFEGTLRRIRAKRGTRQSKSSTPAPTKTQPGESADTEPETPVVGSHNPADLDKIIRSTPDLDALIKQAKRSKKT